MGKGRVLIGTTERLMFLLLLSFLSLAFGLRFELDAIAGGNTRCIREFVGSEALVVVNIKTNGSPNDGQRLTLSITDNDENRYFYRENVLDHVYQTFSPAPETSFDICFTNTIETSNGGSARRARDIELEVLIGSSARDWSVLQAAEKLKPTELLLRKLSEKVDELYYDLQYLQAREERLRDTNESTNDRIKLFFILTLVVFFGLGTWQIHYLRSYFRSKHII